MLGVHYSSVLLNLHDCVSDMGETLFMDDEEYRASIISDTYTSNHLNGIYGDLDYQTGEWKKVSRWDWI